MTKENQILAVALAASIGFATSATAQTEMAPTSLREAFHAAGGGFTFGSRDPFHVDEGCCQGRPDSHAPIGVMGDHTHAAGEWMVSLRAMRMHMEGLRDGTSGLSESDVFARGFMVTPTEMDMDMWMLGAMYAPTDRWTLMAMVPYLDLSMDHVTASSVPFTTKASGLGDVSLSGLCELVDDGEHRFHATFGVSLPTGSIDERGDTPAMTDAKLPYPMQLGTGTFDLLPGLTYQGHEGSLSWGAQGTARVHLGENDEGYRHGDRQNLTGWLAHRWGRVSASARLSASHWENFKGSDPELNPAMVPTASPDLRGGDRVDALLGVNWHKAGGALPGLRLALEVGAPIYEDLDGPQLETDWTVTLALQYAF